MRVEYLSAKQLVNRRSQAFGADWIFAIWSQRVIYPKQPTAPLRWTRDRHPENIVATVYMNDLTSDLLGHRAA